jgi:hypothetical protein
VAAVAALVVPVVLKVALVTVEAVGEKAVHKVSVVVQEQVTGTHAVAVALAELVLQTQQMVELELQTQFLELVTSGEAAEVAPATLQLPVAVVMVVADLVPVNAVLVPAVLDTITVELKVAVKVEVLVFLAQMVVQTQAAAVEVDLTTHVQTVVPVVLELLLLG